MQMPQGRNKWYFLGPGGLKPLKGPEGVVGNEIGGDILCGPQVTETFGDHSDALYQ